MYGYIIRMIVKCTLYLTEPAKRSTHLMHLDADHGLGALVYDGIWQQPASGSCNESISGEAVKSNSELPFRWFQFGQPLSRIPCSSNVPSIAMCFWFFANRFFIEFPKCLPLWKMFAPKSVLCFETWCLSALWNPWSGAQSNASHQRVSLAQELPGVMPDSRCCSHWWSAPLLAGAFSSGFQPPYGFQSALIGAKTCFISKHSRMLHGS